MCSCWWLFFICVCEYALQVHVFPLPHRLPFIESVCVSVCMQKPSLDKCAFKYFDSPHRRYTSLFESCQWTQSNYSVIVSKLNERKKMSRCNFKIFSFILMVKMVCVDASKEDRPKKNNNHTHTTNAMLLFFLFLFTIDSCFCTALHVLFIVLIFFLFLYRWCKTFSFHTTFVFHSKFIQYFPCLWINDSFFLSIQCCVAMEHKRDHRLEFSDFTFHTLQKTKVEMKKIK